MHTAVSQITSVAMQPAPHPSSQPIQAESSGERCGSIPSNNNTILQTEFCAEDEHLCFQTSDIISLQNKRFYNWLKNLLLFESC